MKLIKGEFKEKLDLLFAPSLKAGFPSPAEDYLSETLDFNKDLIKHPEATFYAQIDGDSMTGIGIKEGMPYFQMAEQFPNQKIAVFSSNYELYGELTSRVIMIISQEAPAYFRYSIDECFVYLDGMEHFNLQKWGENLHRRIKKSVGMPVSIGLAPNKTYLTWMPSRSRS